MVDVLSGIMFGLKAKLQPISQDGEWHQNHTKYADTSISTCFELHGI